MSDVATKTLCRFESLVKAGSIESFSVSVQDNGLLIRSEDGSEKQVITLDSDTFRSVDAYFDGIGSIRYGSFDYTSLKSLINAKAILDRMLHNKEQGE